MGKPKRNAAPPKSVPAAAAAVTMVNHGSTRIQPPRPHPQPPSVPSSNQPPSSKIIRVEGPNYSSSLKSSLYSHLQESNMVDLVMLCGGVKFVAHRLILSARSGFFNESFKHEKDLYLLGNHHPSSSMLVAHLYFFDINPQVFSMLLQYMYQGAVDVPSELAIEFGRSAIKLQVNGIYDDPRTIASLSQAGRNNSSSTSSGFTSSSFQETSLDESSGTIMQGCMAAYNGAKTPRTATTALLNQHLLSQFGGRCATGGGGGGGGPTVNEDSTTMSDYRLSSYASPAAVFVSNDSEDGEIMQLPLSVTMSVDEAEEEEEGEDGQDGSERDNGEQQQQQLQLEFPPMPALKKMKLTSDDERLEQQQQQQFGQNPTLSIAEVEDFEKYPTLLDLAKKHVEVLQIQTQSQSQSQNQSSQKSQKTVKDVGSVSAAVGGNSGGSGQSGTNRRNVTPSLTRVKEQERKETLEKAIVFALQTSSIMQACNVYGVPKSTLASNLKRRGYMPLATRGAGAATGTGGGGNGSGSQPHQQQQQRVPPLRIKMEPREEGEGGFDATMTTAAAAVAAATTSKQRVPAQAAQLDLAPPAPAVPIQIDTLYQTIANVASGIISADNPVLLRAQQAENENVNEQQRRLQQPQTPMVKVTLPVIPVATVKRARANKPKRTRKRGGCVNSDRAARTRRRNRANTINKQQQQPIPLHSSTPIQGSVPVAAPSAPMTSVAPTATVALVGIKQEIGSGQNSDEKSEQIVDQQPETDPANNDLSNNYYSIKNESIVSAMDVEGEEEEELDEDDLIRQEVHRHIEAYGFIPPNPLQMKDEMLEEISSQFKAEMGEVEEEEAVVLDLSTSGGRSAGASVPMDSTD